MEAPAHGQSKMHQESFIRILLKKYLVDGNVFCIFVTGGGGTFLMKLKENFLMEMRTIFVAVIFRK